LNPACRLLGLPGVLGNPAAWLFKAVHCRRQRPFSGPWPGRFSASRAGRAGAAGGQPARRGAAPAGSRAGLAIGPGVRAHAFGQPVSSGYSTSPSRAACRLRCGGCDAAAPGVLPGRPRTTAASAASMSCSWATRRHRPRRWLQPRGRDFGPDAMRPAAAASAWQAQTVERSGACACSTSRFLAHARASAAGTAQGM